MLARPSTILPVLALPVLALPVLAGLLAMAPSARAAEAATVKVILDGNELFIDARQARVNQTALTPQEITTQNSRGQLLFRSGAAARINRFTQLRLGKSCFLLAKGQVLVSGKQSGCTKSLRLSSRGTNYIVLANEDGSTDVIVLEGTVVADSNTDALQPAEQSQLLTKLLEQLNNQRQQLGTPGFQALPEAVQEEINSYGNSLIKAMKDNGGCFHGGKAGVGSPFAAIKLPAGWSVLGEVLGCPAQGGLYTPESLAKLWWGSPIHQRIVFTSQNATSIGCVWSQPKTNTEKEVIVCLTLKNDQTAAVVPPSVEIKAGYRFRFSADGKVLSSVKLGPDDYKAILNGPLFVGFTTTMPEFEALYRYITETFQGVSLPGPAES